MNKAQHTALPYEIEKQPMTIGDVTLEILTVKRWDAKIEGVLSRGMAALGDFPLWIKIWEASIVLMEHLYEADIEKDADILEIGAGMGIIGLMLGARGYRVTITDNNEDALVLLEKNVEHNGLDNVRVQKLDWNQPGGFGSFDMIYGAELIYRESDIDPVIGMMNSMLAPGGRAILAHEIERFNMVEFIRRAKSSFKVDSLVKTMNPGSQVHRVAIHTFSIPTDR